MQILDCSLNMIKKLENARKLRKIRLGGRDVYHLVEEVEALAQGGDAESERGDDAYVAKAAAVRAAKATPHKTDARRR